MFGDDEDRDDLIDDVAEGNEPPEPDEIDEGGGTDDGGEPPAEPPAAKLPPKKAAAKAEPPAPQPRPNHVPLATFLEEKRKFGEAISERDKRLEKLENELNALKNPPKAAPKFAEDPEAYIAHATKESAKEIVAKLDEHGKQIGEVVGTTKQTAEEKAEQKFLEQLDTTGATFAQQQPDYGEALFHVRSIAYRQLKIMHPDATEEQIMGAINKQEIGLARQAIAAGRNPHELAYQLALANGYVKQPPKQGTKVKGKPGTKVKVPPPDDDDGEETLEPDLTLGRSTGDAPDGEEEDIPDPNTVDPFDVAMQEVFKPRRRA